VTVTVLQADHSLIVCGRLRLWLTGLRDFCHVADFNVEWRKWRICNRGGRGELASV
jgi:hypothetical protein